jgi:membrane fusion protein (multidrug efflux system)
MRWSTILFLGALACTGGGDFGDGGWGDKEEAATPVTVVELADASTGAVSDLLVTSATVESERQADVVPQTSGIVRSIVVEEGDAVQQGQVLATLENVGLNEGATRARGELSRLEADLVATRRLHAEGAVSENDLAALEWQVKAARSTLREARTGAGNTRLTAPFDGVVAARDLRVGQLASSSQRAFQIVDLSTLRVIADLPERDVGRVALGQRARLISAYDPTLVASGSIRRIAPVIDAQTGTFRVILELDPGQMMLRPGQYVSVELEVDRHSDVVVVPKKAVVYEDGAPVVYRMIDRPPPEPGEEVAKAEEPKEKPATGGFNFSFGGGGDKDDDEEKEPPAPPSPYVAERIAVQMGLVDDVHAEIVEGIEVGDRVIVVGQSNLKDGAPIKTPDMIRAEQQERAERAGKEDAGDGEAGGEEG